MTVLVGKSELCLEKFCFYQSNWCKNRGCATAGRHQEQMVFLSARVLEGKWKALIKNYMAVQYIINYSTFLFRECQMTSLIFPQRENLRICRPVGVIFQEQKKERRSMYKDSRTENLFKPKIQFFCSIPYILIDYTQKDVLQGFVDNEESGKIITLRNNLSKNILWQWISASHRSRQWSPASYFEDYVDK